jgi:hypothetical protein
VQTFEHWLTQYSLQLQGMKPIHPFAGCAADPRLCCKIAQRPPPHSTVLHCAALARRVDQAQAAGKKMDRKMDKRATWPPTKSSTHGARFHPASISRMQNVRYIFLVW